MTITRGFSRNSASVARTAICEAIAIGAGCFGRSRANSQQHRNAAIQESGLFQQRRTIASIQFLPMQAD